MRLSTSLRPSGPHKGQQCHPHATTSRPKTDRWWGLCGESRNIVETKCNSCPLQDLFCCIFSFHLLGTPFFIIGNDLQKSFLEKKQQNASILPFRVLGSQNSPEFCFKLRLLYTKHRLPTSACTQPQDQPKMGNTYPFLDLDQSTPIGWSLLKKKVIIYQHPQKLENFRGPSSSI